LSDRLLRRFESNSLGRHFDLEKVNADPAPTPGSTHLEIAVVVGYARDPKPRERLDIANKTAIGRRDHQVLHLVVD
jgi:hypothetical protein